MKKGFKNPHTAEWNKKISEGVKRQHAEGRGRPPGFSDKQREKAYKTTWRGENISNVRLHQWVKYWRGAPKECEKCGTTTARRFEWANIDHKYRRVLNDFIRLCTSCHRKYDIEKNNYNQK